MDRYERLWREFWRETHVPDQNGDYFFDRQDQGEEDSPSRSVAQSEGEG